jgi:hypothetical protein
VDGSRVHRVGVVLGEELRDQRDVPSAGDEFPVVGCV